MDYKTKATLYGGVLLLILVITNACTNTNPTSNQPLIKVAAAASTQPVLKALQAAYPIDVDFENYVQASGKLAAQIEQGAGIDLFLSADTTYPAYLQQQGRTAETPVIYAKGSLALWSRDTSLIWSDDLAELPIKATQRLVLADPKAAPYGRLAQQALEEAGVAQALQPQLVYGQNIEQVNLYIYNEVANFALTAHSSLLHPKLQNKGQFLLLPRYQLPQAVALIQPLEGTVSEEAVAFYDYLQSAAAQAILLEYGYSLP